MYVCVVNTLTFIFLHHLQVNRLREFVLPKPCAGPVFAHGTTGAKRTVGAPPPLHKNLQKKKKKSQVLQYCDSDEFIELTVGTSRVLMSKAATNNICSNNHKS
jgi:hypothetical protein